MQKPLIALFITVILLSCGSEPENNSRTIVEGRIENQISDEISVLLFEDFITRDISKKTVALDDSGRFKMVLSLKSPQKVFLSRPRSNNLLFLYPGDSLFVTFDDEHLGKMMHFEGVNAIHNEFLNRFKAEYSIGNYFREMTELAPDEFKALIIKNRENALLFFKDYTSKNELLNEFKQFALAQINYQFYTTLFMYPNMRNQMPKSGGDSLGLPDNYYDFIVEDDFSNDEALINADDYLNAVTGYVRYKIPPTDSYEAYVASAFEFARTELTGATKDYFQAKQIFHMIERTNSIEAEVVNKFLLECESQSVKDVVARVYKKHLSIVSLNGSTFPETILLSLVVDQKGDTLRLGELFELHLGKLIFLDIWSLGCKPCLDEMPSSKALIEKYKNEDIAFIFLSTDEVSDMWRQGIEITTISEGHYQLKGGHQAELLQGLNIKAIPRYLLIGKEGRIIDLNAQRPSARELSIEIDSLLNE